MLVYKAIENGEVNLYGVENNEWLAEDVLDDFEIATNAGRISFETQDDGEVDKLVDLTLQSITTMRQAFEVYALLNHVSLKDTRDDFRYELEQNYGGDEKLLTYYRVAKLDDFIDLMFDHYYPGWRDIMGLIDWLTDNVAGFEYVDIKGYSAGEETLFYRFNELETNLYVSLDEEKLEVIYGGAIDIFEILTDEITDVADWIESGIYLETVSDFQIEEYDESNKYLGEYMKENYNAVPVVEPMLVA